MIHIRYSSIKFYLLSNELCTKGNNRKIVCKNNFLKANGKIYFHKIMSLLNKLPLDERLENFHSKLKNYNLNKVVDSKVNSTLQYSKDLNFPKCLNLCVNKLLVTSCKRYPTKVVSYGLSYHYV